MSGTLHATLHDGQVLQSEELEVCRRLSVANQYKVATKSVDMFYSTGTCPHSSPTYKLARLKMLYNAYHSVQDIHSV